MAFQAGYPVSADGSVLDPNTAQKVNTLPIISSPNRRVGTLLDFQSVVFLSWDPKLAQVINVVTGKFAGSFPLLQTDGGLSIVVKAGKHRIAYFTFGYINDPQVIIATDPLIP